MRQQPETFMKCHEITVKCQEPANGSGGVLDRAANRYEYFRDLGAHLFQQFWPLLASVLD